VTSTNRFVADAPSSKRQCIYADAFRPVALNRQESKSHTTFSGILVTENSSRASPCRSIDSFVGLPLDHQGRSYFYYFREKACRELSSLLPLEYWNTYVLPMSALSQHVQYAIIALAAQHRAYLEEKSGVHPRSLNSPLTYSLHTYGKAITCLNKQLVD
jgi:hypothetical protein